MLPDGATPAGRVRELERELRLLGPINPLALEEFNELQTRHSFLEEQLEDVRSTRRELSRVIAAVDTEIQNVFASAFHDVAENFTELFGLLFPGGVGKLKLTTPDDMLNTGIEVEAKPSGKNVKKLSLLSGGERSLTALAYLFAVFRSRPSPFYVMDEVEAALDDVNLHRFLGLDPGVPQGRAADRGVAPEAHDGGRRLPARGEHAARRIEQGRHRTRLQHLSLTPADRSPLSDHNVGFCVEVTPTGRPSCPMPVASPSMGIEILFLILAIAVVAFGIGVVVVSRRKSAATQAPPAAAGPTDDPATRDRAGG